MKYAFSSPLTRTTLTPYHQQHVEQRHQRLVASRLLPRYRCARLPSRHDSADLRLGCYGGRDVPGFVVGEARALALEENAVGFA